MPEKVRLFIGIKPPDSIARLLSDCREPIESARWVPFENLHLTLKFLGWVDEATRTSVESGLEALETGGFSLRISGTGVFPSVRKPRILWAGTTSPGPLHELYDAVQDAAVLSGFDREDRALTPHITIARLKHPSRDSIRAFLDNHRSLKSSPFRIESFQLFESCLSSKGAVYHMKQSYPLH